MTDPQNELLPHQCLIDGQIVETADGSAWLKDPFEGQVLTHDRVTELARQIKEQHQTKLSHAYEILARMVGYPTHRALRAVLDRQMPDAKQRHKNLILRERRIVRQEQLHEDLRRGGNELHDEIHGRHVSQPSARQVTRTGHLADQPAVPIDQQAADALYHAGPKTQYKKRQKRTRSK